MDLDTFIVAVFCAIDEELGELAERERWRTRGPRSRLADSEVLTMEVVGEYLGIDTDRGLYTYFRQHYGAWFPALRRVHRTTFARQAANLWAVNEHVWQQVVQRVPHEPDFALVDSFPLPVCQFARAHHCRRFRGEAAYGKDTLVRQTFYGFRVHGRLCWPGVIGRAVLAPANVSELAAVPALAEGTTGLLLGDRNYHAPRLMDELADQGVRLVAPYRWASRDPTPRALRSSAASAIGSTPPSASWSTATAPSASGPATPGTCGAGSSASCSATPSPSASPSRPTTRRSDSPPSWPPDQPAHGVI